MTNKYYEITLKHGSLTQSFIISNDNANNLAEAAAAARQVPGWSRAKVLAATENLLTDQTEKLDS